MSAIGFDIGNDTCVIAAAKRGGIDVLLNDEAKRETPSVVSFGDKQRFLGSVSATSNPNSTITQIKRLIGRLYNEPSVQQDLKLLPFVTRVGPRGGILVEIDYLNQKWMFTPVEILGMLFKHLKQIADKNLESPVVDCVIGIPSYFTDLQRREYLDAAHIAGLRPLRLIHDGTAIALGYGMYKTDFSKSGPTVVVIVDIGHCDTQVTIAAFEHGGMRILSHSFDPNLGGRDFDELLFKYFSQQFKEKYKMDVNSNPRASVRLRASCEKVKKVLSANAEAPISIECLIDDTDVRGVIKRDEFEKLSHELLKRFTVPCIKAVNHSGVRGLDEIYTIELVGSGSRIPAITKVLTSLFHKEPTRTLNASECVARGCALRCAMLSPSVIVRDYKIEDIFPYSIAIPLDEVKNKNHQEVMLFQKGSSFPRYKTVTNTGGSKFYFQVSYTETKDFPAGVSLKVGNFAIGSDETDVIEKPKVEFKMKLNDHGIVEIDSALLLEDRTFQSFLTNWGGSSHTSSLEFSKNLDAATTKDEFCEAQKREQMLAEQDKKVEESKDQRNTLESFVYDTRSKVSSAYKNFATDSEKKEIIDNLQVTEDWLYEDSDDEFEQDYTGKLEDLKKLVDPIEKRYSEEKARVEMTKTRAEVTKTLQTCIEKYRLYAYSISPNVQEILYECNKAEQWLNNISPQNSCLDQIRRIKDAIEVFQGNCKYIIRSKLRSLKHDNSNQRDQSMDSDQRDLSLDSDQGNQSVDSDQRDPSVDSVQREPSVDSVQREPSVDSDQRDPSVDADQRNPSVKSDQRDPSVDLDQRDPAVDSDQRERSVYSDQKNQLANLDQKNRPTNKDRKSQPAQKGQRTDLSPNVQSIESSRKLHPLGSTCKSQSANSATQKGKRWDFIRKSQLGDLIRKGQPADSAQKGHPSNSARRGHPANSPQKGHLTDSAQKGQHTDLDGKEEPVNSAQKGRPGESDQNIQPVHSDQREEREDMETEY